MGLVARARFKPNHHPWTTHQGRATAYWASAASGSEAGLSDFRAWCIGPNWWVCRAVLTETQNNSDLHEIKIDFSLTSQIWGNSLGQVWPLRAIRAQLLLP